MARRRRGPVDREVLVFASIILLTGFVIGFLLGRQSVSVSQKSLPTKTERAAPAPAPEPKPKEIVRTREEKYPETVMEAPRAAKPVFPFFGPAVKKETKPRIAVVIDDVGNSDNLEQMIWDLPERVTLAILPRLSHSQYFAREGRKRGFEIILHQPLEPLSAKEANDPGLIRANMQEAEIRKVLNENFKTTPNVTGMNNHRGSKATQDRRVMKVVLEELKRRGLFFLDSMTSANSVGWREADRMDMPYLKRDVFLDNELSADYIQHQFEDLLAIARKHGSAIGIGHYKTSTLAVLKREIERAREAGFQFVQLKDLL